MGFMVLRWLHIDTSLSSTFNRFSERFEGLLTRSFVGMTRVQVWQEKYIARSLTQMNVRTESFMPCHFRWVASDGNGAAKYLMMLMSNAQRPMSARNSISMAHCITNSQLGQRHEAAFQRCLAHAMKG